MHELSIATAIAAIATEHAAGRRVTSVEIRVGRLRQVVPATLTFAFELATAGTDLEGAELAIEHVPVRLRCRDCGAETEPNGFPFGCASCGSLDVDVVAGDELIVESLLAEPKAECSPAECSR